MTTAEHKIFCIAGLSTAVQTHHWSAERRAVGRQHADTYRHLQLTSETGSECDLHNLVLVDQISLLTCFKHTAVRYACSVCFITRFSCRVGHYQRSVMTISAGFWQWHESYRKLLSQAKHDYNIFLYNKTN
jgi:hypothetical protein